MQKILHSAILRPITARRLGGVSISSSVSSSSTNSLSISNEVVAVITSEHSIGLGIEKLAPFLNREVVISVLQHLARFNPDPRVCFRFFVWTSGKSSFRSGISHELIVSMLIEGNVLNPFDLYWSVLDEFRDKNLPVYADAFVVLMLGYWRLMNVAKVVETFSRMRDYERTPNLAAYNVLLNVLVKKNLIMLAMAVYIVLLKSNCEVKSTTFDILIDGLFRGGMIEDALHLFDEMATKGISPDIKTYTVIISGLCKAARPLDALRMFNLMRGNGFKPDLVCCSALLDGFSKCGQIDDAFKLVKSFKEDGYDVGLQGFSSVINGLIRANRVTEAEELFNKVTNVILKPDLILYTIMMRGLCLVGRIEDAAKMLKDMTMNGVMPDTLCFNVLIKGFCDAGLLDEAKSLKLEISKHDQFPDTYTYTILICGLCRNGLLDEARKLFNDMEKLGCPCSAVTFSALIDGLCKAGKLSEAQLTLHKMEIGRKPSLFLRLTQGSERVLDSDSLQKMMENMVASGSVLKAYKLLAQLSDSGVVPNIRTYNILIDGMCKAGKIDVALKLFERLRLKGFSPDSATYATLINGLYIEHRDGEAHKLHQKMCISDCKLNSDVFKTLMVWSCRRKNTSAAYGFWLKYVKTLPGRDHQVLKQVEECFKQGDFENALRSLLEMEIKFEDFDANPCSIWLIGLCQARMVNEALKAFTILVQFNVTVSVPGCVKLIKNLLRKWKNKDAVDIFVYSMEKGYILMPCMCNWLVAALLSDDGQLMGVFEVLKRMKSVGYDLNSSINVKNKKRLWDLAKRRDFSPPYIEGLALS